MGKFTICILSWKKPENIQQIINAFQSQRLGDQIKFYVWNNNPEVNIANYVKSNENIDIFEAKINYGSRAKLFLFAKTETEYVVGWDDDILPKNDALFNMYENFILLQKECPAIVTYHGRRFNKNWQIYYDIDKLSDSLEEVDHFGMGCCLFKKDLIIKKELLQEHGSDIIDDTWASYVFKKSIRNIKYWRLSYPSSYVQWMDNHQKEGLYHTKHQEVMAAKNRLLQDTKKEWKKINETELILNKYPGEILTKKKQPLVSIIMPAYNSEKYIAQAIKSFLKQTYKNKELIIVDDGSKDNTYLIAEKFSEKHKNIKIIRNNKNLGIAKSRNIALYNCQGEFVGHLDADDLLKRKAIKTMVKEINKNNLDFAYSNYKRINKSNEVIKKFDSPDFDKNNLSKIGWRHFGMYKKEIALKLGGFNENLITCSDGDLFVRLGRRDKCRKINKYLYLHRRHGKNIFFQRPHCLDCKKQEFCQFYKEWKKTI